MCHCLQLQVQGRLMKPSRPDPEGLKQFWNQLLKKARQKGQEELARFKTSGESRIWMNSSVQGIRFAYAVSEKTSAVELWIDTGNQQSNKLLYDRISGYKNSIERAVGNELIWDRMDQQRPSRITWFVKNEGWRIFPRFEALQEGLLLAMSRFTQILGGRLQSMAAM